MTTSAKVMQREKHRHELFAQVWEDLIPKVFQDVPSYYDKGNAVASLGICSAWSNRFVRAMNIPTGAKVLDLCTGTHDVPLRMMRRDPSLQVFALDGSPSMLAEGQRRARERGLTIDARICDAHRLPFEDATFDAVTLQFATRHLRVAETFAEILRVLKPGGTFYHNDMLRPASRLIEVPYLAYLRASVWFTAMLFGSSHDSRRCIGYFADAIRHFYKPEEMSELLEEIGFADVRHQKFLTGILCFHIARKPAAAT
jgi:demethylmenaquinone methyltransferase / 2-methoxy-6-polyprenyl-1,4-benzoquinol methylase